MIFKIRNRVLRGIFRGPYNKTVVRFLTYNAGGLSKFAPKNINVVQGKSGQKQVIKDFLARYYLEYDPLLIAAGLNKNEELLDFWLKDMRPEFTILAVHPTKGHIVGIAHNSVVTKGSSDVLKERAAKEIKDKSAHRMACFFADVTEKAKLFSRFNISHQFECTFIATHPDVQKQGIARYLVLHSIALATSAGFPLIRMDCTSDHSSKIAKRLQMEMLPRRQIVDYVDKDGAPWVTTVPKPPNHHLDIYFSRLCPGLCSIFPPPPKMGPEKKKKRFLFF